MTKLLKTLPASRRLSKRAASIAPDKLGVLLLRQIPAVQSAVAIGLDTPARERKFLRVWGIAYQTCRRIVASRATSPSHAVSLAIVRIFEHDGTNDEMSKRASLATARLLLRLAGIPESACSTCV
jgi:hypothetical protein